ncbi:MAG: hypothetical protein PVI51_04860 [candidate division WOR-3 bacterium]
MERYWVLLSIVFVLASDLSCGVDSGLKAVRAGDYNIVSKGTYHGRLEFLRNGGKYVQSVEKFRAEIEQDEMMLLNMITDRFHRIPHGEYRFKFAAVDEVSDCLVLRYFARIFEHRILAGYQIQFVFARASGKLLKIFTAEVPLE